MLSEYLRKKAVMSEMVDASGRVVKDVAGLAVITAALAGLGTGYAVSRLTSPRPVDVDNERKQYLLTDIKLRRAKYEKERKLRAGEPQEEPEAKPAREIRL